MKKILLLGEGITVHRIINEIKGKYKIFVCGKKNNNLEFDKDVLHIKIDYKNKKKILSLAKKLKIKFIIPDGNDVSYLTSSYVANKLNLIGFENFEQSKKIHDKLLTSKKLSKYKFYPKIIKRNQIKSNGKKFFPLIFRPRMGHSGINTKKISRFEEFQKIYKKGFENMGILSKFIKGQLFSHSIFIDSEQTVDFFVKENVKDFLVISSQAPYLISNKKKKLVRSISRIIKDELRVSRGLLHIQYISSGKKIFFVEACKRCPGDFYGDLIKKTFNYNYYKNYANFFLGRKIENLTFKNTKKFYRRTIFNYKELYKIKKKSDKFYFFKSYKKVRVGKKIGVVIFN